MGTLHQLPRPVNPSLEAAVSALRRVPEGSAVELIGYRPAGGGMADYTVVICPYPQVARASLEATVALSPETVAACCEAARGDLALAAEVLEAVRDSWRRAADRERPEPARAEPLAPGLTRLPGRAELYLSGLVLRRREVLRGGGRRPRRSAPRTLVRRWIEDRTPAGAWRQFRLDARSWSELRLPQERIRNITPALLAA